MEQLWANEFGQIIPTLHHRDDLRRRMPALLQQPMPGKVTEGGDRLDRCRLIVDGLVTGELSLEEARHEIEHQLPRQSSRYAGDNRVFASGWAHRLVSVQLSRLYNQAVLEWLLEAGELSCFVPHTSVEEAHGRCALHMAGREHETAFIHCNLVNCYTNGNWTREFKVPEHPHCSHVVRPVAA